MSIFIVLTQHDPAPPARPERHAWLVVAMGRNRRNMNTSRMNKAELLLFIITWEMRVLTHTMIMAC